jgi:endonuclease/exonuclease/phosphatase family metal-dependent hydrolase
MLKDGNDDRGIDVGIMTRNTFDILSIVSHVNDTDEKGRIFSRDCAEYQIRTPSAETLLVLVNHLRVWDMVHRRIMIAKCKRQAKRVLEIYEERVNQGLEFIAIAGDLNDIPDRDPLQPLLGNGSNLLRLCSTANSGAMEDPVPTVMETKEIN